MRHFKAIAAITHILTEDKVVDTGLPDGWEVRWSSSKRLPYYFRQKEDTWDSVWEIPPGTDEEQLELYLNQKIVASHLLVKHNESRNPKSWREVSLHTLDNVLFANDLQRIL